MIATFQIKYCLQITGRKFFVIGDIASGKIKIGMKADFTPIGLDQKLITIEAIEFTTNEDTGLGFSNLTDEEKQFLKSNSPF